MLASCKKSNAGEISVTGVPEQFLRRTLKIKKLLQNISIVSNYSLSAEKMQASL